MGKSSNVIAIVRSKIFPENDILKLVTKPGVLSGSFAGVRCLKGRLAVERKKYIMTALRHLGTPDSILHLASNNMKPELSVIITWFNRPELRRSLAENSVFFDRYDVEVIVVNCGGSKTDLHRVVSGPGPRTLRCLNIPATAFNKSLAINVGASTARSERLFLLDADIVLREDFLPVAFDTVAQKCFFTVDRVLELDPEPWPLEDQLEEMAHQISFIAKGGRKATTTIRRRFHEGSRSGPGLVVLARQHFLEVGGMNADLQGYGWEDRDLLLRLQFALGLEERSAGKVLHLSHPNESQDAAWRDRETGERLNSAACIKNYRAGHYAGTYYDDLRIWKERISVDDFVI